MHCCRGRRCFRPRHRCYCHRGKGVTDTRGRRAVRGVVLRNCVVQRLLWRTLELVQIDVWSLAGGQVESATQAWRRWRRHLHLPSSISGRGVAIVEG